MPSFQMQSPLGKIHVEYHDDKITSLDLFSHVRTQAQASDRFAMKIRKHLQAYFKNPRNVFELPLEMRGTEFQKKVWAAMQRIPAGQTRTYGEIAQALNSSPRAVGNACRQNPVPLIVLCHRVVAKGNLGGYSGATKGSRLDTKKWLLRHEGVLV